MLNIRVLKSIVTLKTRELRFIYAIFHNSTDGLGKKSVTEKCYIRADTRLRGSEISSIRVNL